MIVKNIKIKFLLTFVFALSFSGCKDSEDCIINFFYEGTVLDSSNIPIPDVEVHEVTHYGFDSVIASTDENGKYTYFAGSYTNIGNTYLYFKKTGYKISKTEKIGKGNGTCGDQTITRDAALEVD